MNLATVMDEIGAAVDQITDLRVFPYSADRVVPPAAIVGWPDPLTYDTTFARGSDRITMPLWVIVGKIDARSSRNELSVYLNGSGAKSVKQAIEAGSYTACDSVRVAEATIDAFSIAAVEYLGAEFSLDIIGPGA